MGSSRATPPTPRRHRIPAFLRHVGPGVVTGAADDDPSGIATDTQAGAQFGTGVLWTVFLSLPLMVASQLVSARIGRQSGRGIAAIGEALPLVVSGGEHFHAVAFGAATVRLQVFVPYRKLAPVLEWLTLTLFVYVAVVFTVQIPWREVLHDLVLPRVQPSAAYAMTIVAVRKTRALGWGAGLLMCVAVLAMGRDLVR